MKEVHALMDFENVQPSLEALAKLAKLAPGFTDVWLFHGPHQAKQAQAFAASHARVVLVPRSGQGPNALDFHLSFYLGYVAAKHPDAELVVAANDKGYDPMLAHARITKGLAKMGDNAPTKLKSFLNALKPMLDKDSTAADIEAMAQTLQNKGVVLVQGEVVTSPK